LEITSERIEYLSHRVQEPIWKREEKYRQMGVPNHLIIPIASSPRSKLFEALVKNTNAPLSWIYRFLFENVTAWRRKGLPVDQLDDTIWETFFAAAKDRSALLEKGDKLFEEFLKNHSASFETILKQYIPPRVRESDLPEIISNIMTDEIRAINTPEKQRRFFMGIIMEKCRGHIPAKRVSKQLRQFLSNQKVKK
jgi:Glu-tRNA(Gln) amidotransferase subunit E-like FAD-binding protein